MKINCPECLTEHHFEDAAIPDAGMDVRCRVCGTVFRVENEIPAAEYDLGEGEMVCPKCFITQEKSDTCMCCGLIISKYQPRPAYPPPPSAGQRTQQQQQQQAAAAADETVAPQAPGRDAVMRPLPEAGESGRYTVGELFRGLFDLSFNHLITPGMIKALYGFLLIFGGALALFLVNFFVFSAENYAAAAGVFAVYLFSIVVVRIQAEFLIIFFRIEKNTRRRDR